MLKGTSGGAAAAVRPHRVRSGGRPAYRRNAGRSKALATLRQNKRLRRSKQWRLARGGAAEDWRRSGERPR